MINSQRTPDTRSRLFWLPYIVGILVLMLTLMATYYFASASRVNDQLRFENQVQQTQDSIVARLNTYTSLLRGVSGLFAATDQVNLATFRSYVSRLYAEAHYPGIQGIGFSKFVQPSEVDDLTAAMRAEYGMPQFHVWPGGPRPEYTAIIYLEPLDQRNIVALGFDMFTEPVRRAAMERARDTGQPAISGKVTLVQEIDTNKQPGFLIYVPVYRNGMLPQTPAERRANLVGYAYSPFRSFDLFNNIFSTQQHPQVAFQIYDGAEPTSGNLIYRSNTDTTFSSYQPSFTTDRQLNIAGRDWTIVYTSQPAFENANAPYILLFVLLAGSISSLALFFIIRSQVHARAEAEAAVRVRDIFLSVASHELKSPLTVLQGNAQLLLRRVRRAGALLERDERSLHIIIEQVKRLDRLVNALLDHSRLQSGHFSIDRQPMNFAALVQQIVQETQPILHEHTLEINHVSEPLMVLGDELRLGQVLQNLIGNAIKYSPYGGIIVIDVIQQEDYAVLSITDSGVGIPESALPHLFEPFYRAPNITSQKISGLGIGLHLAQDIVHQHDGSIAVTSAEGTGSTFTVRLPLMTSSALLHLPVSADQRSNETIHQK